jgi:hypothetical protein
VKIGQVVAQGNTQCPFCKKSPKFEVIKKLEMRHLRNLRPTKQNKGVVCQWNPQHIYAACSRCLLIKPAFDRVCAGVVPQVINYVCDECNQNIRIQSSSDIIDQAKKAVVKQCPSCKTDTIHAGGCNHMTCTMKVDADVGEDKPKRICDTHWCWTCGASEKDGVVFDAVNIYEHMADCGGIFPDEANNDDDDDYDGYDG